MKALTIKQPALWAILNKGKNIENRFWETSHRGWIALHASGQPMRDWIPRGCPDLKTLNYFAICGVARITRIVTKSSSKWFDGQPPRSDGRTNYGWVLADVTTLPTPIDCKGMLKLWTVSPKILRAIQRQLPKLDLNDA